MGMDLWAARAEIFIRASWAPEAIPTPTQGKDARLGLPQLVIDGDPLGEVLAPEIR